MSSHTPSPSHRERRFFHHGRAHPDRMPPGVVDRVTFGVYDPHAASAIDEALGEMQVRWHGLDHPVLEVAARDWGMLGELRDVLDSLHASAAGSPISPDDLCLLLAGLGFADATTEDD